MGEKLHDYNALNMILEKGLDGRGLFHECILFLPLPACIFISLCMQLYISMFMCVYFPS